MPEFNTSKMAQEIMAVVDATASRTEDRSMMVEAVESYLNAVFTPRQGDFNYTISMRMPAAADRVHVEIVKPGGLSCGPGKHHWEPIFEDGLTSGASVMVGMRCRNCPEEERRDG